MVIPATRPLALHREGKLHPPSVAAGVKSDTTKLRGEGSLTPLKMNLFILIVWLIMLGEDIDSWTTFTGSDRPDKLTNMNNSIR
jgi:hypothetical protein